MLVSEPAPSWLLVIDVTYTDGKTEAYAVPVAVATGPTAAEIERRVDSREGWIAVLGRAGELAKSAAPTARRELLQELRRLRDDAGTTIVLTTHLIQEAAVAQDITFTATPASTAPGQMVTLAWDVSGTGINIEIVGLTGNGLPPSGSHSVFPNETTTYVLKVTDALNGREIASKSVTVTVSAGASSAAPAEYLSPSFKVRE
jgi:hypothetical protein